MQYLKNQADNALRDIGADSVIEPYDKRITKHKRAVLDAAPDMLEALEEAEAYFAQWHEDDRQRRIRAAIRKAKGEQP
jgi:hypothetical protein